jgi:hypothetical protein
VIISVLMTEQAGWNGNAPDPYYGGIRFESRPGHRLC